MRRYLALVPALVLVLAACVPTPTPSPVPATATPLPAATAVPTAAPLTPPRPPAPPPGDSLVELVRRDLAQRLGVDASIIALVSADTVEWPSTALGCPEPGRAYSQVITPGSRIVLAYSGKNYEYHTDRGQRFVLCTR